MRVRIRLIYTFWIMLAVALGFSFGFFSSVGADFALTGLERFGRAISFKQGSTSAAQEDVKRFTPQVSENTSSRQTKLGSLFSETVTLAFLGDMMLDRGVASSVEKHYGGDWGVLFGNLAPLKEYDVLFANLEGPISDVGVDLRNLYSFRMDPEALDAIKDAGFDVLSVANNHMGDWGRSAFEDTLVRLREAEILAVGGGENELDASVVKIIQRKNLDIGFVGFSDVGPKNLAAGPHVSGILLASEESIKEVVPRAKDSVDILVASFHFGNEYQHLPSSRQRTLAHLAIDMGADIVIGHHPHVPQPVELYHGGVIAYSLGNFIFDQNFSNETMQGVLLEVPIVGGKVVIPTLRSIRLNRHFIPQLVPETP